MNPFDGDAPAIDLATARRTRFFALPVLGAAIVGGMVLGHGAPEAAASAQRLTLPTRSAPDVAASGDFAHGGTWRIEIHKGGSEVPPAFYVDFARQAAEIGASVASADDPATLRRAGGAGEFAHVRLDAAGGRRDCIGFRFIENHVESAAGIVCGARLAARGDWACWLAGAIPTREGLASDLAKMIGPESAGYVGCKGRESHGV